MPANLSPEYLSAEAEYRQAQSPAEKVAAVERMISTLPKHKGTEKMLAELRRRLSQLRKESVKKGAAHAAPFYHVAREGAGQVALAGPPNSGKSQLVCALTHARPEVADYPFTTRVPTPGMMHYEDVPIQLLDLPPIAADFTEPWMPQVLRYATLGVLIVDLAGPDALEEVDYVLRTLESWRVPLPRLLVGNKHDLAGADQAFGVLAELYQDRLPCLAISALTGYNLDRFARALFDALSLVRVYTKAPGRKADLGAPYLLRRGETVLDAARHVHKDFAEHLKFARLFRPGSDRDGLMVDRHHVVDDRDILEFHI